MDTNFLLIVAATLLVMFFLFGFSDCKSCCTPSQKEGFCGCTDGNSLYIRHSKPSYYGWGPWGYHYGEPYYYNEIRFTNK
jgi:hypothetical protein